MGTGEHARQLVSALRCQGLSPTVIKLDPSAAPEDERLTPAADEPANGRFAEVNLLCVNADMVPLVADQLGSKFFSDHYTIGFWAWETSAFPRRFELAFRHVDEVWVGSRHVQEAVQAISPVPVVRIPQPVSLPPGADQASPPPGLDGGFRFLFVFDYLSVFERKNPLAVVEAFSRSFPPGSGAALIIKTLNHGHDPTAHERLRTAAAQHPDITLIEDRLSAAERDGLINAADCYVSLHRAEGFGYTLAEAMWLGKPVIATGYSGNVDFMTADNSHLVDYRLVPIGPGNDPYPADGQWAEPDVAQAGRLMREVFEHRDAARALGSRAASDIRRTHGPEAAGRVMRQRLETLARSATAPPSAGHPPATLQRADELIRSGPVPPRRSRFGGPQRSARRALLRLLRPIVVHQGLIDSELVKELDDLRARVRRLEDGRR
jgi:glycosyltransferase involved in cell wall biosynthesis